MHFLSIGSEIKELGFLYLRVVNQLPAVGANHPLGVREIAERVSMQDLLVTFYNAKPALSLDRFWNWNVHQIADSWKKVAEIYLGVAATALGNAGSAHNERHID